MAVGQTIKGAVMVERKRGYLSVIII